MTVMHISAEHDTRYNMNTKKLIGTSMIALLVVTLSVGMAAAMPATVVIADNPITNPLDGTTVTTTTLDVTDIDYVLGDPQDRYISVDVDDSNLWVRVLGNGADTGWTNSQTVGAVGATYSASSNGGVNADGNYTFTLEVKGTAPSHKHVSVRDNFGTSYAVGAGYDDASCTRPVDIPEFATIAIPMVALLGLVLYMRRKKD